MQVDFHTDVIARAYGKEDDVMAFAKDAINETWNRFRTDPTPNYDSVLRYMLREVRQGVFVMVLSGSLRLMLVLINKEYKCPFVALKDTAHWANQHIICTESAEGGWGLKPLEWYEQLIAEVCLTRTLPDKVFALNRRDCPMLRADGKHCYTAAGKCRDVQLPDFPVFSIYGGSQWLDKLFPEPYTPLTFQPGWTFAGKIDQVFFAGSSTGRGFTAETNDRIWFCYWSRTACQSDFDFRITKWNQRYQLVDGLLSKQVALWPAAVYVPMENWHKYRYLMYIQGYSAALRYFGMMWMDSVIIRAIPRTYEGVAPDLWFFDRLKGATIDNLNPDADHMVVHSPHELPELLETLRKCPKFCESLIQNCRRKAIEIQNSRSEYVASLF